jgi:hypothetical protein
MINAAKVIASQPKGIKLADRLDVSVLVMDNHLVLLAVSMTLPAIAKRPALVLARINVLALWVASLLYINVHLDSKVVLSLVGEAVTTLALKSVNVVLALFVIFSFCSKESSIF